MSDQEIDFDEQIRLEKLKQEEAEQNKTKVDEDGTVYEWDESKRAWFPKIDEDFIASYQLNYGTTNTSDITSNAASNTTDTATTAVGENDSIPDPSDPNYYYWYHYYYGNTGTAESSNTDKTSQGDNSVKQTEYDEDYYSQYYQAPEASVTSDSSNVTADASTKKTGENNHQEDKSTKEEKSNEQDLKRKIKEPPKWFEIEDKDNTSVYVCGMPPDVTIDEFKDLMNKCGMIMQDPDTRKLKLKLYTDHEGNPKGDGLCVYIKRESVDLAFQLLDDSDVRGYKISVELAKFEMKGSFDPNKRKKQKSNKLRRKLKEKQERLFDWHPDKTEVQTRPKSDKIVVLENVFDPKEFETEPTLINEVRDDLRAECQKYGEVKKVLVHDQNEDGVAQVTFATPEEAEQCVLALNTRWFAKRRLFVHVWDGKKKYAVEETDEERQKRLKKWDEFLLSGDEKKEQSKEDSQGNEDKVKTNEEK